MYVYLSLVSLVGNQRVFYLSIFFSVSNQNDLLMHFLVMSCNGQVAMDGWDKQIFFLCIQCNWRKKCNSFNPWKPRMYVYLSLVSLVVNRRVFSCQIFPCLQPITSPKQPKWFVHAFSRHELCRQVAMDGWDEQVFSSCIQCISHRLNCLVLIYLHVITTMLVVRQFFSPIVMS